VRYRLGAAQLCGALSNRQHFTLIQFSNLWHIVTQDDMPSPF
jgi:hypothetical protein